MTQVYRSIEDFTHYEIVSVESLQDTLVLGDCFELLKYIPDNSIKVIIIDPPYHLSKHRIFKRDDAEDINMFYGEWDEFGEGIEGLKNYLGYIYHLCDELYRVLAKDGTLFVFCIDTYNSFIKNYMKYKLQMEYKATFIWYKKNPPPRFMKKGYSNATEYCCVAQKSKQSTFNFLSQTEMKNYLDTPIKLELDPSFESGVVGGKERLKYYSKEKKKWVTLHPTQKPEELTRKFILSSSNEGDLVADFMMGAGTTQSVAKQERRRFLGSENLLKYFDPAVERIKNTKVKRVYQNIADFME